MTTEETTGLERFVCAAAKFAERCHKGQLRKYTNRPYIEHPARVAARVSLLPDSVDAAVCAAWLHDVIEDCNITAECIESLFGPHVSRIVVALTNTSKVDFPNLNRAARKAKDRERIVLLPRGIKCVKLIDRIDNLREMSGAPEDFKKVYASESRALLEVLRGADAALERELENVIAELEHRDV